MTCYDIICRALRRIGVLAAGQTPRDIEASDALAVLLSIYQRIITEGLLGELRDVIPTADYTAGENERVIRNSEAVGSIDLPDTITECDHTRPPRDGALVIISDQISNTTQALIYDGAAKNWLPLTGLTLTDIAPLATRDAIGLGCYLALELADEYGQQPTDMTRLNAARFHSGLTNNWSNPRQNIRGIYF